MSRVGLAVANGAAVFLLALLALFLPVAAYAGNGSGARGEFSDYELSRLFEETDDDADCQFVMCDYSVYPTSVTYLKVRTAYRSRYDAFIGDDAVSFLSARESDSPDVVYPGRPLVRIGSTASEPWNDLLVLIGRYDAHDYLGTAFMVDERVAVTAAHCTMEGADFYDFISAYSNYDNLDVANSPGYVSRAIVPVEWYAAAAEGADRDHDFAILVFDSAPVGTTVGGLFAHETITVADSIGLSVNCAGWLSDWDDSGGIYAWRNASDGGISLLDDLGNEFHMNLSAWHGMSGGPVYTVRDGEYVVVGIVTHNDTTLPYWNHAMRITEACDCAVAWAEEGGFGHLGSTGGGASPFTGPGDDFSLSELQVAAQQRIQATQPDDIPEALERAMELNPDVFAWLHVPGTNVSVPVARREGDGSYYLRHDSFGNESPIGCAYTQQGAGDLSDAVTVLYGHSFSAGSLAFTSLHEFEDYAFFAGHEKVYLYLPERRLEYRVVGANLFNARAIEDVDQSDPADLGDYFAELSNPDPGAFVGLKRRFSLDAANDRVLQLSTCTAPADPAHRFVVTCVLEGERGL